jgi:3alpha(or 20beta)-hydroxysteroid dehydrogenase
MELFSIRDKVAVITGGGSGIGLATAKRFVAAGAKVLITNRRDSSDLARESGFEFARADVGIEEDMARVMKQAADRFGRIDILVNNAGHGQIGPTAYDMGRETLEQHLKTNTFGVVYATKHALAHMPKGGAIVNVSSLAGLVGVPTYGAYVASKYAVIGLTKTAAIELAPQGIRVNAVCPGTIDTPINHQGGADAELELVKTLAPVGRIGQPEEVAALIHFLASNDASYVTGEAIGIDGGWLAGPSIALFEKIAGGT